MIRQFALKNGDDTVWYFTDKTFKSFLNNPNGLGFRKNITVTRYGERANENSETYDFPTITGELIFYDSANADRYTLYNQFCRFLVKKPLRFYYSTPTESYNLLVDVTQLDKTESKTDRMLTCPITFTALEFYNGEEVTRTGTSTAYTLTNNGDFPIGFEITVEGNLKNPYVTLEQDGELYGEAKFLETYDSVYVNSIDGEQSLELISGGSILANPANEQDLSISNGYIYVTFMKLKRGESTLTIGMDSGSITNVEIKFTPQYRSV